MYSIKIADKADNKALIQLTRLCPMQGTIPLLIDRTPDFFLLPAERGESVTLVAINPVDGVLIGTFTTSFFTGFIEGRAERILYISDLKVHPDHRKKKVALELMQYMDAYVRKSQPGIAFCVLAGGNEAILRFFQIKAGFPEFVPFGQFHVLQIFPIPGHKKIAMQDVLQVQAGPLEDALITFFNAIHKDYVLAPVLEKRNLGSCRSFVSIRNNKIVAAVSLIDPHPYKQNVVLGMPGYLKLMVGAVKATSRIMPLAPLPNVGAPIATLFLRAYGCLPGEENRLKALINFARKLAYREGYNFLSVGIHERDPMLKILNGMPRINFLSHLYVADFLEDKQKVKRIVEQGIPYMDFSLV
ncbi:MAG: GNAT family N-acetyltransferase [Saprospiraceae bacterium]|nr:GNAT family N-acetyltransferase [Saprospiraceae bacterium]